ncbi:hypothetical protein [Shigella dysenteriae]
MPMNGIFDVFDMLSR